MHNGLLLAVLTIASSVTSLGGQLVTDEAMKLRVMQLAFPDGRISNLARRPPAKSFPVKDPLDRVIAQLNNALVKGSRYEVTGPVAGNETEAAIDITNLNKQPSDKRQVQMVVYKWNTTDDVLLIAALSYKFLNANPAGCCTTIGKILLLSNTGHRILDVLDRTPYRFSTYTDIRFLRGAGAGSEKLLLSADLSGPAFLGVSTLVLDVSEHRLKALLATQTMIQYQEDPAEADVHTLTLDEGRTRAAGYKQFFFIKKSYIEDGKIVRKPATKSVSYPAGTGLPLEWE